LTLNYFLVITGARGWLVSPASERSLAGELMQCTQQYDNLDE